MSFLAVALQGVCATAQGQSFIGHSDSVTGLAWADPATLISTGAGDAVLIWHLTPAALKACEAHSKPTALSDSPSLPPLANLVEAPEPSPALDMTQAFDSFHAGDRGSMRHSLEATAGLLPSQTQALAADPATVTATAAIPAAVEGLHIDPAAPRPVTAQPALAAGAADATGSLPASQHHLLAKIGDGLLQQQHAVHSVPPEAGLYLERVVGFNGAQHGCCVWLPETGLLVYASDHFLVLEELASREQR